MLPSGMFLLLCLFSCCCFHNQQNNKHMQCNVHQRTLINARGQEQGGVRVLQNSLLLSRWTATSGHRILATIKYFLLKGTVSLDKQPRFLRITIGSCG